MHISSQFSTPLTSSVNAKILHAYTSVDNHLLNYDKYKILYILNRYNLSNTVEGNRYFV
ncbi:unnamed protein product [Tenebrio molitor]|nr:unnamed protein product [Tenebrio molitor]